MEIACPYDNYPLLIFQLSQNAERGTWNAEHETRNVERETWNAERGTRNIISHAAYTIPTYLTSYVYTGYLPG